MTATEFYNEVIRALRRETPSFRQMGAKPPVFSSPNGRDAVSGATSGFYDQLLGALRRDTSPFRARDTTPTPFTSDEEEGHPPDISQAAGRLPPHSSWRRLRWPQLSPYKGYQRIPNVDAANLGPAMPELKQTTGNKERQLQQVYLLYIRDAPYWAIQFKLPKEDFEDCVQEAWIKAASHLAEYDAARAGLRTWFHGILWNGVRDFQRSRRERIAPEQPGAPAAVDESAPVQASGEYHVLKEECQQAVQELLRETNDLLSNYAPAHKAAFDCLIDNVALKEIAGRVGRSEESVGASLRRKRQQFVAALNLDTPLGERLRHIKALAREIADLRHMLDLSLDGPAAPLSISEITRGETE